MATVTLDQKILLFPIQSFRLMDTLDIFDNSAGDDGQFEEELTAAEVLQKLEDAWLNEKHSPEILEPRMEIVECMLEQVGSF